MGTYLDIVEECDNFPYPDSTGSVAYLRALQSLWLFFLPDDPEPHGFLIDSVVARMPWGASFRLSTSPRKEVRMLTLFVGDEDPPQQDWRQGCNLALQDLIDRAREANVFPRLGKRTTASAEQFPIVGARFDVGIERPAFSLFGIVGRGAHMTVYVRTREREREREGIRFWIPRRSATKSTYPGMLDQAVAGGVARGETPLECIVREAGEEAGLSPDMVRSQAVAAGTVSWFNVSDEKAGGEVGLMNPGVLYVYDLAVGEDVVFRPVEGDIEEFRLMDVQQVQSALRNGEFKPSCAMVMIDFLVRHGFITAENEPDYQEIVSRLHRKLPFRMRN